MFTRIGHKVTGLIPGSRSAGTVVLVGLLALAALFLVQRSKMIEVEVDAFSGRPNPTWSLTTQEGDELRRRLLTLPGGQPDASVPDHLGYRGLLVTGPAAALGGFEELRIYHGNVFARDDQGVHLLTDPGHELE